MPRGDRSAVQYVSENWPEGVGVFGEVVAAELQRGDVLAFHNMLMHGTSTHVQVDRVRWSIDLRYMATSQGFSCACFYRK
jgi:hypothetical protein